MWPQATCQAVAVNIAIMTKNNKWADVDRAANAGKHEEACILIVKNFKPCVNYFYRLGKIKLAQGKPHLAAKCLKVALSMQENIWKKNEKEKSSFFCPKIVDIVDHLSMTQKPRRAEAMLKKYIEFAAEKFDIRAQVSLVTRLGHILVNLKRVEEARGLFMECFTAIVVFKNLFSELILAQNQCNIAKTFIGFDNSKAQKMSAEASKQMAETFGEDHIDTLKIKMCEVATLHETGEKCLALERVMSIVKKCVCLLGVDHPQTKQAIRYSYKMSE